MLERLGCAKRRAPLEASDRHLASRLMAAAPAAAVRCPCGRCRGSGSQLPQRLEQGLLLHQDLLLDRDPTQGRNR
jgi:hypothetical protein